MRKHLSHDQPSSTKASINTDSSTLTLSSSIHWITAHAGSGKTAYLIEKMKNASSLGLTFSNAAAQEINQRTNSDYAYTLHGFCLKLLIAHNPNYSIISQNEEMALWEMALEHIVDQQTLSDEIVDQLHLLEKPILTPYSGLLNTLHVKIIEHFKFLKYQGCYLSFDDILHQAHELLELHLPTNVVYQQLQNVRVLCIDEAQDLSYLQWKIIFSLIEELIQINGMSIYICGDEKQSIYSFQGACINSYKRAKQALEALSNELELGFESIVLNRTYRLPANLCKFVDCVMNDEAIRHISAVEGDAIIEFIETDNQDIESQSWIEKVVDKIKNIYDPAISILILIRKRNVIYMDLRNALIQAGFPAEYQLIEHVIAMLLHYCAWRLHGNLEDLAQAHTYFYDLDLESWPTTPLELVHEVFVKLNFEHAPLLEIAFNASLCADSDTSGLYQFYKGLESVSMQTNNTFTQGAISIQTIYQTKGQEADVVFLCDTHLDLNQSYNDPIVNKNQILTQNCAEYQEHLDQYREKLQQEHKRLLYVALTRAKKHLVIVGSPGKKADHCWMEMIHKAQQNMLDNIV